jgi:hypothetical protein
MVRRIALAALAALGIRIPAAQAQAPEQQQGMKLRLPYAPVPENAAALANKAVEAALGVDGIVLDYTPESLRKVDEIVLGFHRDKLTMANVGETVFVMGCYIGEVFVRIDGAQWIMPGEAERRVGFEMMGIRTRSGKFLNPLGKVMKLLENGEEDSVMYFYTALHAG